MYLSLADLMLFGGSLTGSVVSTLAAVYLWAYQPPIHELPESAWPMIITAFGTSIALVLTAWFGYLLKVKELNLKDVGKIREDYQRLESLVRKRFETVPIESLAKDAHVLEVDRKIDRLERALVKFHPEASADAFAQKAVVTPDAIS